MHCLDYVVWPFYSLPQSSIKICGIQEATRNKQEQHINKDIKNFVSENCYKLSGSRDNQSICAPATPCSTTCTPRLITLEGQNKI